MIVNYLTKLRKLLLPNAEVKRELKLLKDTFKTKLEPPINLLNKYHNEKAVRSKKVKEISTQIVHKQGRLDDLTSCFDRKNETFESLNGLIKQSKDIQSDLKSAYDQLKKAQSSKTDYYDWANRNKSLWNGYSGRKGKKVRSNFNPMGVFNKYTKGDIDRFKANITSAKSLIDRLKSRRTKISSKIQSKKRSIGELKELCGYVKTPEGKAEIKDIKHQIPKLNKEKNVTDVQLTKCVSKIDETKAIIKEIKADWSNQKRNIKIIIVSLQELRPMFG
jgi:chromosome segregation ATPase